jgi:nuclear migration protein JNM1
LGRKLARLRREAEEVRLELERREQEKDGDGEFRDSVEQQHGGEDDAVGTDGLEELSRVLDELSTKARPKTTGTLEDEFLSRLDSSKRKATQNTRQPTSTQPEVPQTAPSALSAVAAFSDRLTALESALGISSASSDSQTSILPTLDSLSTQITVLSNTLTPKSSTAAPTTHSISLLDTVSSKLKTLIAESDRLTASRKQALQALSELHESRMRNLNLMSHTNTRPRRGFSNASSTQQPVTVDVATPGDESLQIRSQLFLDEQSSKINALYQLLPSIQTLQPLLPVVLERLRALSVIHAGAAEAKNNLDTVEKRQAETREEIQQWRQAVEDVEKGMSDLGDAMKGNVKVIGDMVSGLESRISQLHKGM